MIQYHLQRTVVPWKLWVAVGSLLVLDLILLLTWSFVDPLRRQVHNFAKEKSPNPEDDVEIQPQLEHCKSTHHTVWLGERRNVFTIHTQNLIIFSKSIYRNYVCL